jgi:ligand-binding sensor domain-containing protein
LASGYRSDICGAFSIPLRLSLVMLRILVFVFLTNSLLDAKRYPILVPEGARTAAANANSIAQDPRGAIWIGGPDGLAQFDGERLIAVPDPQRLLRTTTNIAVTSDGRVFAGSPNGLHVYWQGTLTQVLPDRIQGLAAVGTRLYLALGNAQRLGGDSIAVIDTSRTGPHAGYHLLKSAAVKPNADLTLDREGNLWFGCGSEYCHMTPAAQAAWTNVDAAPVVQRESIPTGGFAVSIVRDGRGCLWVRDNGMTGRRCPGGKLESLLTDVVSRSDLTRIGVDRDGNLWATGTFLTIFPNSPDRTPRIVTGENGLPGQVRAWLQARDGSIWMATSGGLAVWPNYGTWEYWGESEGLKQADTMVTVRVGQSERLVAAGTRLYRFDSPRRERLVEIPQSVPALSNIHDLLPTGANTVMAAFYAEQAREIETNGRVLLREQDPGLVDSFIRLLPRSPKSSQFADSWWILGSGGTRVMTRGRERIQFRYPDGLPQGSNGLDGKVLADGTLFVCTDQGLHYGQEGRWSHITVADGLLENDCESMTVRNSNEVFYGYVTKGSFSRIVLPVAPNGKPAIQHFTEAGGYGNTTVRAIDIDARDWIWRGTPEGIYIAKADDLGPSRWFHLSSSDGLRGTIQERAIRFDEEDGSVWIGAGGQLHHIFPDPGWLDSKAAVNHAIPFISGHSINGRAVEFGLPVRALETGSALTLYVGSTYYKRRGAFNVRYRLQGDADWSPVTQSAIAIPEIETGRNVLDLEYRVLPGEWQKLNSIVLPVPLPLTRNPVFYAGTGLLLVSSLGFAARLRSQRQRAQQHYSSLKNAVLQARSMTAEERAQFLNGLAPDLAVEVRGVLGHTEDPLPAVLDGALPADLSGLTLGGRYLVQRLIGKGGFATLYFALDLRMSNRPTAIKVIDQTGGNGSWGELMDREVEVLSKLRHPGVVAVFDRGLTPWHQSFLALEFIPGRTLRVVLEEGPLPIEDCLQWMEELAGILDAIHIAGVVHRDLKPENLMLRTGTPERIVVIDLGIATVRHRRQASVWATQAAGSLDYMAPEQIHGLASPAADVYSFALIVIECLTGKRVGGFAAEHSLPVPEAGARLLADAGFIALSDIALSALAYVPSERPASASTLWSLVCQKIPNKN